MDYLMGQATPDDILLKTQHDRLTVIPSGTRFQRGPELLSSSRMHELYATLRNRFEVVLVDSPPLGAGIDPYVLGTITGNLMVVLRTGGTDRQMAEAKIQMLDRLPIRVLGAVLNDIKSTMGHYRYYGYSYGYGVEGGDEAEAEKLQPVLPTQS
jgi:Mrp family chromosome partitioning ATPase